MTAAAPASTISGITMAAAAPPAMFQCQNSAAHSSAPNPASSASAPGARRLIRYSQARRSQPLPGLAAGAGAAPGADWCTPAAVMEFVPVRDGRPVARPGGPRARRAGRWPAARRTAGRQRTAAVGSWPPARSAVRQGPRRVAEHVRLRGQRSPAVLEQGRLDHLLRRGSGAAAGADERVHELEPDQAEEPGPVHPERAGQGDGIEGHMQDQWAAADGLDLELRGGQRGTQPGRAVLEDRGDLAGPDRGAGQASELLGHRAQRGLSRRAGRTGMPGAHRRGSRPGRRPGCTGSAGRWPHRAAPE